MHEYSTTASTKSELEHAIGVAFLMTKEWRDKAPMVVTRVEVETDDSPYEVHVERDDGPSIFYSYQYGSVWKVYEGEARGGDARVQSGHVPRGARSDPQSRLSSHVSPSAAAPHVQLEDLRRASAV